MTRTGTLAQPPRITSILLIFGCIAWGVKPMTPIRPLNWVHLAFVKQNRLTSDNLGMLEAGVFCEIRTGHCAPRNREVIFTRSGDA